MGLYLNMYVCVCVGLVICNVLESTRQELHEALQLFVVLLRELRNGFQVLEDEDVLKADRLQYHNCVCCFGDPLAMPLVVQLVATCCYPAMQ